MYVHILSSYNITQKQVHPSLTFPSFLPHVRTPGMYLVVATDK